MALVGNPTLLTPATDINFAQQKYSRQIIDSLDSTPIPFGWQ
jgi:hypothetical protein